MARPELLLRCPSCGTETESDFHAALPAWPECCGVPITVAEIRDETLVEALNRYAERIGDIFRRVEEPEQA